MSRPDFGEPWTVVPGDKENVSDYCDGTVIVDRDDEGVACAGLEVYDENPKCFSVWKRIVACANAMAGIPDPAAFLRAANELASRPFHRDACETMVGQDYMEGCNCGLAVLLGEYREARGDKAPSYRAESQGSPQTAGSLSSS